MATAQERTLEGLAPDQVEWIQTVVNDIGRELVYTEGIYILPVSRAAEVAVAEQFALDHDADLRTLAPEGVRVGAVNPERPRVWFRPNVPPLRIYDGDLPRFAPWPVPHDPTALQRLVQVQERLSDGIRGQDKADLLRLRELMVREACGAQLAELGAAAAPSGKTTVGAR